MGANGMTIYKESYVNLQNILFENVNGFEICNQFEDGYTELTVINEHASFRMNPIVVVWLLFGVSIAMTAIYVFVVYHSGCIYDGDKNGKLNSEQTPLLRHV